MADLVLDDGVCITEARMRFPRLQGVIRRRILVNYAVDPRVMQRFLPEPFRPKLHNGVALAGICLIRLERIRPHGFPPGMGFSSENAAHRIAVRWTTASGREQEGVYVQRRDSNSLASHLVGGRLFPGKHHRAAFEARDCDGAIDLSMRSLDGTVAVAVRGIAATKLPEPSVFGSIREASDFFEAGSLGYSETENPNRWEGMILATKSWRIEPLTVAHVHSSFFSDLKVFPPGSVAFDCALVMRNVDHEWRAAPDLLRPPNRARALPRTSSPSRREGPL